MTPKVFVENVSGLQWLYLISGSFNVDILLFAFSIDYPISSFILAGFWDGKEKPDFLSSDCFVGDKS